MQKSCRQNESKPHRKEGVRDWRNSAATICLIVGIALSFAAFAFCVCVYIYETKQVHALAQTLRQQKSIASSDLSWLQTLQGYYQSSSNFNIIMLVYGLISSVLVAWLGAYIERQKQRVDEKAKDLSKMEKQIAENFANLSTFELLPHLILANNQTQTLYIFTCQGMETGVTSTPISRLRDIFQQIKHTTNKNTHHFTADTEKSINMLLESMQLQLENAFDECEQQGWKSFSREVGEDMLEECGACRDSLRSAC